MDFKIAERLGYTALAIISPPFTALLLSNAIVGQTFTALKVLVTPTPTKFTYPLQERVKDIGRCFLAILAMVITYLAIEVLFVSLAIYPTKERERLLAFLTIEVFKKGRIPQKNESEDFPEIVIPDWVKAISFKGPQLNVELTEANSPLMTRVEALLWPETTRRVAGIIVAAQRAAAAPAV